MTLRDLLQVLLRTALPALAGGAVALLATWRWRSRAIAGASVVTVAYLAGHWGARGVPAPLPLDHTELVFHFALFALLLPLRTALCALMPWLLLRGLHTSPGPVVLAGLGAACAGFSLLLERRALTMRGDAMPAAAALAAAAGAQALVAARSALLAEQALAVAVGFGLFSLFQVTQRRAGGAVGTAPHAALLLPALCLCGHYFAALPWSSALLLALTPLVAFRNAYVSAVLAAPPTALALWLAG